MNYVGSKKNILIAPLDWGLGHATRCIPLIRQLKENYKVYVASSGGAAELLKQEFPELEHLVLPSYRITYPVKRSMSLHMAFLLPSVYATIIRERKLTAEYVNEYKLDVIISDNRFGVYCKKIPSVFITHQVNIKTPYLNKMVNRLNTKAIRNFTACWIPDYEKSPGLAGELSHPAPQNMRNRYIGPLSRFTDRTAEKKYDITVVLSGPEPQRTLLEDKLFEKLFQYPDLKINLVRGIYETNECASVKNIQVYDHLDAISLEKMLHESKHIICRSGYSTIMDLQFVRAKILWIPTPQQTEQEYLANLHSGKSHCMTQLQDTISLEKFLESGDEIEIRGIAGSTDFSTLISELV